MIVHRGISGDPGIQLLTGKLGRLSADLQLTDGEIEGILRLPPGVWPLGQARAMRWKPEAWQEARLRRLVEVLVMIEDRLGEDARAWLRNRNHALLGRAPLDLLISEPAALRAIRDRLREEEVQ